MYINSFIVYVNIYNWFSFWNYIHVSVYIPSLCPYIAIKQVGSNQSLGEDEEDDDAYDEEGDEEEEEETDVVVAPSIPLPETTASKTAVETPSAQRMDPLPSLVQETPDPALPSDSPILAPAEPPSNPPGVASEALSGTGLKY